MLLPPQRIGLWQPLSGGGNSEVATWSWKVTSSTPCHLQNCGNLPLEERSTQWQLGRPSNIDSTPSSASVSPTSALRHLVIIIVVVVIIIVIKIIIIVTTTFIINKIVMVIIIIIVVSISVMVWLGLISKFLFSNFSHFLHIRHIARFWE